MAINVELRRSNGTTYDGDDNLVYLRSHVNLIDGLLNDSNKINPSLLPASVFGGLKYMGPTSNGDYSLEGLRSYINQNLELGDTPIGKYFIHSGSIALDITSTPTFVHHIQMEGVDINGSEITLENGDWVVLDNIIENDSESGITGYYWSVVNNTYHYATLSVYGITKLTNTVNNTITNLSVTPKGVYDYVNNYVATKISEIPVASSEVNGLVKIFRHATVDLTGDLTPYNSHAVNPDGVKYMIDTLAKIPVVSSVAEANNLPQKSIAGSLVLIQLS